MDDLLQSQIREGCKLALPEGLQELMSDISREVLRYQPENLYQFIANYLEALLNAREALSIACRICGDVSNCSCQPQLEDELCRIGLSHEDVTKAKNIILDHFDKGQVQETSLLVKLATKTSVTEMQLVELQKAIQRAFQRYILKRKDLQVSFARLSHVNSEPSEDNTVSSVSTQSSASDFYKPSFSLDVISELQDTQGKQFYRPTAYPQFKASLLCSWCALLTNGRDNGARSLLLEAAGLCTNRPSLNDTYPKWPVNRSVSATTLAGSHVSLPERIPYSVHNSEGENILVKSEKSVLSLLKSILFPKSPQNRGPEVQRKNMDPLFSFDSYESQNTENEEIDDTIKSVFSQDIYEVRSRSSKDSRTHGIFKAIQENLNESSSGGS